MSKFQFGLTVAAHRKHANLTQKQLGEKAGYLTGAAVSISRIENSKNIPSVSKVRNIAEALNLSKAQADELAKLRDNAEKESSTLRDPAKKKSIRLRQEQIQAHLQKRIQITEKLAAANQTAIELASTSFFNSLIETVSQIDGAPVNDLHAVKATDIDTTKSRYLERAEQQLEGITRNLVVSFTGAAGVLAISTIAGAVGGAAKGGFEMYVSYTTIARFGYASTGTPNSDLHGIARKNSVLASMGGGTIANGGKGRVGGFRAIQGHIASEVLINAVQGLAAAATQLAVDRIVAMRELAELEKNIKLSEPRFQKWQATIKRGTDLLTYISVHGSHALKRWQESLGELPQEWSELTDLQKLRFQELLTIAACESVIDMTPTDQLLICGDHELAEVEAEIDAAFETSEVTVKSLV